MEFKERVWGFAKKVPKGRLTTYKLIALKLRTKAYRAVGKALRLNPFAPKVPCHRVVCSDGSVGGYKGKTNSKRKIALLKKEGIIVEKGKIKCFEKKLFRF